MTARIYQPAKSAMTSGQAKSSGWVIEFGADSPRSVDPLMGWTGQSDTSSQVRLTFASKEAALEYATRNGIAVKVETTQKRRHRPRGYGDNFAFNRRVPWSH